MITLGSQRTANKGILLMLFLFSPDFYYCAYGKNPNIWGKEMKKTMIAVKNQWDVKE